MLKKRRLLAVAALALSVAALGGCETATPYQPYIPEGARGVHGGYSDQQLAPDRFLVRFHGNDLASRERVEGYLLYRAAELTVQQGYDWFMMDDRRMERDRRTVVEPDLLYQPWYGYPYWRPYWGYYGAGYGWQYWNPWIGAPFWHNNVRTYEAFEASAEVAMRRGPVNDPRGMNAREVMTRLAPTIELPKPG